MWIEKKRHYNNRVSLHEAPTKNIALKSRFFVLQLFRKRRNSKPVSEKQKPSNLVEKLKNSSEKNLAKNEGRDFCAEKGSFVNRLVNTGELVSNGQLFSVVSGERKPLIIFSVRKNVNFLVISRRLKKSPL